MSIFDQYPEVDSNGQRFRWMGEACKEYMPMVHTTFGTVPMGTESPTHSYEPAPRRKSCPFSTAIDPVCRGDDCAFMSGDRCRPGTAQTGKRCPLSGGMACGGSQIKDFLRIVPGAANAPGWEGEHCQTKN